VLAGAGPVSCHSRIGVGLPGGGVLGAFQAGALEMSSNPGENTARGFLRSVNPLEATRCTWATRAVNNDDED
jgi:hypothetical protein